MASNKKETTQSSNREYKSSAFAAYYSTPERAADLYRALESEEISQDGKGIAEEIGPEDIVFETLQGVLYLARKNDIAFTVRRKVLIIGEHQSTINENMPLRSAIYYGRTMERIVEPRALYKAKKIPIPTPEFYVFYNGKSPQPLEQTLYLSDSYLDKTEDPMLQLKVKVININLPEHHPLLEKCRSLYEYSWFIQRIREYLGQNKSRDASIALAMEDCVKEGLLVDFIREHGSEVRNMLFGEFNLEVAKEVWEEEAREDGREKGLREGELKKLIQQVCRKLQKDKTPETIADELEEDYALIQKICRAVEETGASYDCDQIYDWIKKADS